MCSISSLSGSERKKKTLSVLCFFLLKVFFELADKEGEEERRPANEKPPDHQGPRNQLINWLVKRRKISM